MRWVAMVILVGALLGWVSPGHTAQTLRVSGQEDLIAVISAREVTRLSVRGDRITSMVGGTDALLSENNKQTGDVFLRPDGDIIDHPINLFVTTERGETYKLVLTPQDVPSEDIIIFDSRIAAVTRSGSSSSYPARLATFLIPIIRDERVDCLWSESPQDHLPDTSEGFGLYSIGHYFCDGLIAEEIVLIGDDLPLILTEREIAERFGGLVMAVWLESSRLPSFGEVRAIVLREINPEGM